MRMRSRSVTVCMKSRSIRNTGAEFSTYLIAKGKESAAFLRDANYGKHGYILPTTQRQFGD